MCGDNQQPTSRTPRDPVVSLMLSIYGLDANREIIVGTVRDPEGITRIEGATIPNPATGEPMTNQQYLTQALDVLQNLEAQLAIAQEYGSAAVDVLFQEVKQGWSFTSGDEVLAFVKSIGYEREGGDDDDDDDDEVPHMVVVSI